MKKLTLAPRDAATAPDAERVNAWLEARDDVQRLDADAFVLELSSADIATQAEIFTAHGGEPIQKVRLEVATVGAAFGAPLTAEVQRFAEQLAAAFDLVALVPEGTLEVTAFFDTGRF